jgi:hypothetical protein
LGTTALFVGGTMPLRFNPPPNWPTPPQGWTPPAGWEPDPTWGPVPEGWQLWVSDAEPAHRVPAAPPRPALTTAASGPKTTSKVKKWPFVAGAIVIAFIIGSCAGGSDETENAAAISQEITAPTIATPAEAPTSEVTRVAEPEPVVEPEPAPKEPEPKPEPAPNLPSAEEKFVKTVKKYETVYDEASTELKRSKAVTDRNNELCNLTGGSITSWVGEITEIGSNNDGHAHIEIRIDDNIRVQTWNNAVSDMFDDTLIQSGSKLWEKLSDMDEGARVEFTGEFVADDEGCLRTTNMTETFGVMDPQFLARFTDVSVIK